METFEEPQPIEITKKKLYLNVMRLYNEFVYVKRKGKKYLIYPQYKVRGDLENFIKFNNKE